jgi:hypothetical protein
MSQVQVSRFMSDRLDRDRPASIQLTTSNNENKANRLHPFYGIRTYGGRYKAQRSITIKEQQIDQALMIYHVVVVYSTNRNCHRNGKTTNNLTL